MINAEGFKKFLLDLNLKESSIKSHFSLLKLMNKQGVDISDFDSIEPFLENLLKSNHSGGYLSKIVCTIRRYNQFLQSRGKEVDKRLLNHKLYGCKTVNIKATMSDKEIDAFIALPPPVITYLVRGKKVTQSVHAERFNRMTFFFKILAQTGMRPGETANLSIDDVDLEQGVFSLRDTKTEPRLVPIPLVLIEELSSFIEALKGKLLFPSLNHLREGIEVPIKKDVWEKAFNSRIKRLGIGRQGLCPYSLRHSFITSKIAQNFNLFNIQRVVGHRNIKTTAQYIHLTVENLRSVVDQEDTKPKRDDETLRLLELHNRLLLKICERLDIGL